MHRACPVPTLARCCASLAPGIATCSAAAGPTGTAVPVHRSCRQRAAPALPAACSTRTRSPYPAPLPRSRGAMSGSIPDGVVLGALSPRQQSNATQSSIAAALDDGTTSAGGPPEDVILQYIVLRRDLWTEHDWPLGSVVAQVRKC